MKRSPSTRGRAGDYWRVNLLVVGALLAVWFAASHLCGIVFADALNQVTFFGFKLGFWFAQQGAIYIFVVVIFVYVLVMNQIDRMFGVDEEEGIAE